MTRRTVVRGAAWSVPVVAVAAQAPAFAVSTHVCTSNYTSGVGAVIWSPTADAPAIGPSTISVTGTGSGGVINATFTAVAGTGTTLQATNNMAFRNTGLVGAGAGTSYLIGDSANLGAVVNSHGNGTAGTGNQTVTVKFTNSVGAAKTVQNLAFWIRDLSYFNASEQERVSFSIATNVTNKYKTAANASPNPNLNIGVAANTGPVAVAAGSPIYRTAVGIAPPRPAPDNGQYYDILVEVPVPVTEFSFTYGYGPASTTSTSWITSQLSQMTWCAANA